MKQLYPAIKTVFVFILFFGVKPLSAQSLSFRQHDLVNGGEGQKGAEYRFTGVISDAAGAPLTDCIVRIDNISAGVQLKNIDFASGAEDAAFQPLVEHMNTLGPSWIEFSFSFVPHQMNPTKESITQLPMIAASIYGLNGFDRAQEFAECDLGRNSQVIYENGINNLMVTRTGNAFRAENKWGVQTAKFNGAIGIETFSLLNQQVSNFKVKFGVNRKNQSWAGISKYNLSVSNNAPELTAKVPVLNPGTFSSQETLVADGNAKVATYKRNNAIKNITAAAMATTTQVELGSSAKQFTAGLKLGLPLNWIDQEVVFDIYNSNGEILRKVIEHKANGTVELDLQDLAAGAYLIRATCGKEFAVKQALHMEQL